MERSIREQVERLLTPSLIPALITATGCSTSKIRGSQHHAGLEGFEAGQPALEICRRDNVLQEELNFPFKAVTEVADARD
jgi:hypothetical protein